MRKIFFSFILICCTACQLHAQDKHFEYSDSSLLQKGTEVVTDSVQLSKSDADVTPDEKDILSDTALHIHNIAISSDSVLAWKTNKKFAYVRTLDSLLKIKQQQAQEPTQQNDNAGKSISFLAKLLNSPIVQVLFWAVAIAFVLFIIYKLFLSNGIFKRTIKDSKINELPAADEEQATVSDYDKMIQQACRLGNYRAAVRALFLKTLAHLSEKEYLQRTTDKTNYQYVQEIPANKKKEFASLVLTYEYIWYGNFELNKENYTGIEHRFIEFYAKL